MAQIKRPICNEETIHAVSEELGLSLKETRELVKCQSEYTKKIMESNTFDGVRWPFFGVFKAKPKMVQIASHMRGLTKEGQRLFKLAIKRGKIYNNEKD